MHFIASSAWKILGAYIVRVLSTFLFIGLFIGPDSVVAGPLLLFTGEWRPYSSSNPDEPGITTEIVLAAFEAAGVETTLEFAPWARCEQMVREGACDDMVVCDDVAVFPYVRTPVRERFAKFSVPMLMERTYLYYNNSSLFGFDFTGYAALRKYRLGTLNGFVHQELFRNNLVSAVAVKNITVGLKMLLLNRLDLFPVNDLVASRELREHFSDVMDRFGRSATPMYEVPLHLMVSRKNPRADDILSKFAEGMAILREQGRIDEIAKRYE